jgi:hypothetical protein
VVVTGRGGARRAQDDNAIAVAILKKNGDIYGKSQTELLKKAFAIKSAMRKELGIDPA